MEQAGREQRGEPDRLVAEAESLHREQRWGEAESRYRRALELAPARRDVLLGLAYVCRETGRPFEALEALRALLDADPADPIAHHRIGIVLMTVGRLAEGATHFRLACRAEPGNPQFSLNLGTCLLLAGDTEGAQAAFQRAVVLDPQLYRAVADQRAPAALRRDLQLAQMALNARFVAFNEQTLDEVSAAHPGADLTRLRRGLGGLVGDRPPLTHPRRRAAQLYFPDVPEVPWFDPRELPWMARVRERHPVIRAELDGLMADGTGFEPYVPAESGPSAAGADLAALRGSMDWNACHLFKNGERQAASCARCPETAALFDELPIPRIRHHSPEIVFSRLRPGAHIGKHHGLMNVRLTVHLALIVPPDCGISVDGETRHWQEGEILAFDDSFEHEAWNHSERERVVLIFEAWHPDLSEAEKTGVQRVFELRREWLDRFEAPAAAAAVNNGGGND